MTTRKKIPAAHILSGGLTMIESHLPKWLDEIRDARRRYGFEDFDQKLVGEILKTGESLLEKSRKLSKSVRKVLYPTLEW